MLKDPRPDWSNDGDVTVMGSSSCGLYNGSDVKTPKGFLRFRRSFDRPKPRMKPSLKDAFPSAVVLVFVISAVSTCFITNCPIGGKRSMGGENKPVARRECTSCGPRGTGRCYGPSICCGPEMGCHVNTVDALVCKLESAYPVSCFNEGDPCGENMDGKCAADGVCCSEDQCVTDDSCRRSSRKASGSFHSDIFQMFKRDATVKNAF